MAHYSKSIASRSASQANLYPKSTALLGVSSMLNAQSATRRAVNVLATKGVRTKGVNMWPIVSHRKGINTSQKIRHRKGINTS